MDKNFDIRITRGHGPGGQHKNKVETCVVVTHIPTGIKERCQDTRSRERNINLAKERLEKKIKSEEIRKINEVKNNNRLFLIKNQKVIRTYNFNRNEVYDHRTKVKANLKKVFDGQLDLL